MGVDILVIGAAGRLGRAVTQAFERMAPDFTLAASKHEALDASDSAAVEALCKQLHPKIVINAAAYTDVAKAEALRRSPKGLHEVMAANAVVPGVLAKAAAAVDASLIHFSTDYVFSGGGLGHRSESDKAKPYGVYGRSKRIGELAVLRVSRSMPAFRHLIFRVGWLHGAPGDFVSKVLDAALAGRLRCMRSNQWGRPTSYESTAELAVYSALGLLGCGQPQLANGVYHYAESGPVIIRFRLAVLILHKAAEQLSQVQAPETADAVERLLSAARMLKGICVTDRARPSNCRLNCGKLASTGLINCFSWDYYVDKSVENFLQSRFDGILLNEL